MCDRARAMGNGARGDAGDSPLSHRSHTCRWPCAPAMASEPHRGTGAMHCAIRDELPPEHPIGDVTRHRRNSPQAGLGHRPNLSIATRVCTRSSPLEGYPTTRLEIRANPLFRTSFCRRQTGPIARRCSSLRARRRDGTTRTQASGIINQ
jgi:hypothetical protein